MLVLLLACDSPAPSTPPPEPPEPPVTPPAAPPDPCRHAVLEQLSPAALSEVSGDEACLSRAALWRDSIRRWAATADLDGDGVSENIVLLTPARPAAEGGYPATLIIGSAEATLTLHWPDGHVFGDKTLRLIDIDTTDQQQELLIQQRQPEPEDPSLLSHIFTYASDTLTESQLTSNGYTQGELTISGDGRVGVADDDCAHRRTLWYRREGMALVSAYEEETLKPGAEEYRQPDGGYSCPG